MPFFFASTAPAQVFRLGTWEGAIEGVVDFNRQDTRTGDFQQTRFQTTRTEERLTLRNVGAYVYDPRLVRLSLGGTFGLSQEWRTTESGNAFDEGTLWGYEVLASILSGKPYSLNVFANRNQSFLPRELAGLTQVQSEIRGATLFARRLYIPSTLTFRQELQKEESHAGDLVTRRDDRRNILTYEGQRGWIDSEMDLRYEFTDHSDEILPTLSYRSHEGNLNYSLDFGSELNWHWDSRLRALMRTGLADLTTWTVDESLRVEHTERLRTEYRYLLTSSDTLGGATSTHSGVFTLRHRLYESLTTTVGADAVIQTLPGGQKNSFRGRLDLAYTKRLPWDGRLSAGLGGSFQYEDDRFNVTESFVPQETLTFGTPFALPIPLRNPFVVISSVVVTKVSPGPLPVGCIPPPGPPTPLVLGLDFTLRTVGDITEIEPIPCAGATPGINPGDTIAVDYRFAVPPYLTFTTATWHADFSVDYRWIRPYFVHEETDQHLLSGQDGRFLDNQRSDTVGTELRYDGRRLRANLLAEARRFASHRVTYNSLRSTQFVGFSILPELTLNLSADQSFVDYPDQNRQTQMLTGRAALTYALNSSLFADAVAGIRWLKDTLSPTERTIEASLRVRWLIRKLEVSPTLSFFDRHRGNTDTKEYRGMLHIIRRF